MHIVFTCQRFFFGRGQEIHVYNLANELAKSGHKITICTSDLDQSSVFKKELKLHQNIKIHISKGIAVAYPPNQVLFPNLAKELLDMPNIDIIHAHGAMTESSLIAITIAKTLKVPFVFTPHFHPWRFFEQRPYRYTREAYESVFTVPIIKNSTRMIAVSPFEKNYLVTRRGVPPHKIKIIANGINTFYYPSIVSRRSVRSQYKIPENRRYIITFGSITDARKGLDRSLKIFELLNKKIPNSHLIIAGWKYKKNNDYLSKIFDNLKSKNNISTLGYVSEDEKVALIKMSEVLFSPTSYEAFGIVLGEAMTLEVPVVVTRVGGTPYIVRHAKTGFTVGKYNSIKDFVYYILELMNNEKQRNTMGQEGKRVVKKFFTWKKIAKEVEDLYDRVRK